MRRLVCTLVLLTLLGFVLPVSTRADTMDITNRWGTVLITNAGIVSQGSHIWTFNGTQASPGHALGTVSFATGALSSGSIWTGGTFSSVGSSFVVIGQHKSVLFSGAFEGVIDWTLVATAHKFFHEYELTGKVIGQLLNGHMATGTVTETIYTYWNQEKIDHRGNIHLGTLSIASTPEPSTLGLLGTGLVAVAGALRRKIKITRS